MKVSLTALLLLGASVATTALAQPPGRPPHAGGPGGPRPIGSPLVHALDTDADGILSADEIAAASASLKTRDKNDDGKLTPEELHPARPFPGGPDAGPPPRGGRFEGPEGKGAPPRRGRKPGPEREARPDARGPLPFFGGLDLTEEQHAQLKSLHEEFRGKFESILTDAQREKMKELGPPPGPPRG